MRAIFCFAVLFDLAAFFSLSLRASTLENVDPQEDPWSTVDDGEDDGREELPQKFTVLFHNEEFYAAR